MSQVGPKARKSDSHSHGGSIIEGSPNALCNGLPIARVGDSATCPIHGLVSVASGSSKVLTNGIPTARQGIDIVSCGAVITSGSPNTDHGGS